MDDLEAEDVPARQSVYALAIVYRETYCAEYAWFSPLIRILCIWEHLDDLIVSAVFAVFVVVVVVFHGRPVSQAPVRGKKKGAHVIASACAPC